MKINKYLKELGLTQMDMPGYYGTIDEINIETASKAGADIRNQEDEEGFCAYEFFNLDRTLSLFIYSKLCYFREYIAGIATPGSLCPLSSYSLPEELRKKADKTAKDKWLSIIDKMILAFKIDIVGEREGFEGIDREAKREGMQLFIEYYNCLWY